MTQTWNQLMLPPTDAAFPLRTYQQECVIALVPSTDGYSVWAYLDPGFEQQRWWMQDRHVRFVCRWPDTL